MSDLMMLEVREARGPFGRFCKVLFWVFQAITMLLMLATCAFVTPFLSAEDPEVVLGAGMFGAVATASLWVIWPLGTVVLGGLALLTRGRKRLIPAPLAMRRAGSVPDTSWGPRP